MYGRRGLLSQAFDVCLGVFVAALLLSLAVQLVEGIEWWLLGGLAVVVVAALVTGAIRYHRNHW